MKKLLSTVALVIALMALAACGETKTDTSSGGTTSGGSTTGGTTAGAAALTFDSGPGAENKFIPETMDATAGEVAVTFNNKGVVPHNWTLVKPGEEDKAATESQTNAPDYKYAGALAQTKTLNNAGASDTVTVKLEPGTYSYICTFPGHYQLGMKGTLTVK